tara:strand:- start:784 stop:1080 length:297 start_codon:yes stop_codon:yes gene_type:complete
MTTRNEYQAMKHGGIKGTEYKHPLPKERKPEGADQPKEKKKKKPTKEEYADTVVRESLKDNPKRSLYDLSELGKLAKEQYDDNKTYNLKQEKVCLSQI